MRPNRIIYIYTIVVLLYLTHILEELIGNTLFVNSFYNGTANFLIINIVLLLIPINLRYLITKNKKSGYKLRYIYAIIIIIDRLNHIMRNYPKKYSAIGLIIFNSIHIYKINRYCHNYSYNNHNKGYKRLK